MKWFWSHALVAENLHWLSSVFWFFCFVLAVKNYWWFPFPFKGNGQKPLPLRLLLIITFIFSIAFLELSSDTPLEQLYFQSIPTLGRWEAKLSICYDTQAIFRVAEWQFATSWTWLICFPPEQCDFGGFHLPRHTTSHPAMCDLPCLDVSRARDAIVSLILHCIVPDQEVFFKSLADENWILGVLVLLFILLGSLTVMKLGSCTKLDSFGQHTVGANGCW